ncbi:MAG: patatin-like phospholipase family protein [Bacteroidales bacterium]
MTLFIKSLKALNLYFTLSALMLLYVLPTKTNAQSIGVALGGGGAKGMAHIGFIQAFEDKRVPIDYIGGTSIGAVVGGLYASGYTPSEMIDIISSDKFGSLLRGDILEKYKYYSRRERTATIFTLGVQKGKDNKLKFVFPTNFISESPINLELNEIFASANAYAKGNFNNLFVPFRCIATNIYAKNKMKVFRSGDLGYTIRASMAFPIVFKAVEINDSIYFDGGIMNNLPADILIDEFSPDFTVAHKVTSLTIPVKKDDLYHQLETVLMRGDNLNIPKSEGIVLHTDMSSYSLLDFSNIDSAYLMGYKTAEIFLDSMLAIGKLRQHDPIEHEMNRDLFNLLRPKMKYDNLTIKGIKKPQEINYIYRIIKPENKIFDLNDFANGYYRLLAEPMIKDLKPVLKHNQKSGFFDIDLYVEKEQPFRFNLGGHLSTLPANQLYLSANYNLFSDNVPFYLNTSTHLGQFYNSLSLTSHIEFPSKHKFYLKPQIKAHSLTYKNILLSDFLSSSLGKFDSQKRQLYAGVKMELPATRKSSIILEPNFSITYADQFKTDYSNTNVTPEKTKFTLFAVNAIYKRVNKDRLQYSKTGGETIINASIGHGKEHFTPGASSIIADEVSQAHNFISAYIMKDKYFSLTKRNSVGLFFEGMFSLDQAFTTRSATNMYSHAFTPTPTSQIIFNEELRSNNYLSLGLRYIYSMYENLDIRLEGYAFAPFVNVKEGSYFSGIPPYNTGNSNSYIKAKNELVNPTENIEYLLSSAIVYNTSFGPISVSFDYTPSGNNKVFIGLNLGFLIFDKMNL